jgi:hypothetical protein
MHKIDSPRRFVASSRAKAAGFFPEFAQSMAFLLRP